MEFQNKTFLKTLLDVLNVTQDFSVDSCETCGDYVSFEHVCQHVATPCSVSVLPILMSIKKHISM